MKLATLGAMALAALSLCACSSWSSTSGGAIGAAQDKAFFVAKNDQDYVYRAMAITAGLAKIATSNTKNSGSTKQAIAQINGLMATLSSMYEISRAACGAKLNDQAQTLSDCVNGINRQRFQSMTADVDSQLLDLAAVSFKTDELKSLFADLTSGNVIGALWGALATSGDIVDAADKAYAVKRMGVQGRAYVLAYQTPGSMIDNFQTAATFFDKNSGTNLDSTPNTQPYQIALQGLFQDIRQSCYSIRSSISNSDKRINNCPNKFSFNDDLAGQCLTLHGLYVDEADIQGNDKQCDCTSCKRFDGTDWKPAPKS